jgi:hypothetical protein
MFAEYPRLSVAEIIDRYMSGESLTLVALRAKVSDVQVDPARCGRDIEGHGRGTTARYPQALSSITGQGGVMCRS